jgi:hypothetical protein
MRVVFHQSASVRYQARVIDAASGKIVRELPMRKNLIMDGGLNRYAVQYFVDLFSYSVVGTGTNPTNRYSAPVTFTQAGNTVTASLAFFANTDVGYILKYGASGSGAGGAEQYITAYTSPTSVTVSSSAVVGAVNGCLWYVNQTALQTQVKNTSTYAGTGNSSVFANGGAGTSTLTHTRIFQYSTETGPVTYNEIGWSWDGTSIFGRDLITPSGIALVSGQQLQVTLQVALQFGPCNTVAVGDVSGGTWNTSGNALIEYMTSQTGGNGSNVFTTLNSAGNKLTGALLEPVGFNGYGTSLCLIEGTWTQQTTTQNTANLSTNTTLLQTLAGGAYTPGSFSFSGGTTLALATGNGVTFNGIALSNSNAGGWVFSIQLTTPNSKDAAHTLSFTFTLSWGRILVN